MAFTITFTAELGTAEILGNIDRLLAVVVYMKG